MTALPSIESAANLSILDMLVGIVIAILLTCVFAWLSKEDDRG